MKLLAFRTFRPLAERKDAGKAVLAGMAGGLAGAWAMNCFSAAWERSTGQSPPPHSGMHASRQEWDTTLNTATVVARYVLHRRLREQQRERGAVAVHYAVAASMGAGYAVLRELLPNTGGWPTLVAPGGARPERQRRGATGWGSVSVGAAFGAALWLGAQEIGMPLLHLSGWPRQYSLLEQAQSFGEHLAYGVTTELVRCAVRAMV